MHEELKQKRQDQYQKFRRNIRILRAGMDLSAEQVSKKLGMKHPKRFIDLEYGRMNPKTEDILCISEFFGVTLDNLIYRSACITFY